MKKITLFLILTLTSCGISYDGETKLISDTTVLDRNGNFLSGIEIKILARNSSDEDLISSGFSNSYGNTRLIFSPPKNASIEISFSNDEMGYDSKSFNNIKPENFDNYKLVMDEVILLKTDDIVYLDLSFNNTFVENKSLVSSYIEGLVSGSQFINPQDDEFYIERNNYIVGKNQNIFIHYTLIDNLTKIKTNHIFPILIENEPVTQTINY